MESMSLKKINSAALAETSTHKKLTIIINILYGIGAFITIFMISAYTTYDMDGIEAMELYQPSGLGTFLMIVGMLMGILASSAVFREMGNVQTCDVQLSLPMSAKERYFSKLLALGYLHIFPTIIYPLISLISVKIYCAVEGLGNSDIVVSIFFMLLAAAFFTDAVTVFCTCCCGAVAESIYFSVIVIGCLSLAPTVIWYRLVESIAGIDSMYNNHFFNYWTYSFVVDGLDMVSEGTELYKFYGMLIVNCLISIALMLVTFLIYRKRDARTVGSPISSRLFFELVMLLGVFTVYSVFLFYVEFSISLTVVAVIYIVINVIVSRGKLGLRSFMIWLLKYAASTALFFVVSLAGYYTDGFGAIKYVPAGDLSNAIVNIDVEYDSDPDDERYRDSRIAYSSDPDYYFTDQKDGEPNGLSNAQVRELIDIYKRHAKPEKSLSEFFKMSDNAWGRYNYANENGYISIDLSVEEYSEKGYGDYYTRDAFYDLHYRTVLSQTLYVPREELEPILTQLDSNDDIEEIHQWDYTEDYSDDLIYYR